MMKKLQNLSVLTLMPVALLFTSGAPLRAQEPEADAGMAVAVETPGTSAPKSPPSTSPSAS